MRKAAFIFSLVLFLSLGIAVLLTQYQLKETPLSQSRPVSLVKKISAKQFDSVNWDEPQSTSSTSYVDMEGSTLNFTLDKKSSVLILADVNCGLDFSEATQSAKAQMFVAIDVDGQVLPQAIMQIGERDIDGKVYGGTYESSASTHKLIALDPGPHGIKLIYRKNQVEGAGGKANVYYYVFSYLVLEE